MNTQAIPTGKEKAKIAAAVLEGGGTMREAANALGYRSTSSMRWLLTHHGFEHLLYDARSNKDRNSGWFCGKSDPSKLTTEELERCAKLGIEPARWAWLSECPKGGNATGSHYFKL